MLTRLTPVVKNLLIINAIFFLATWVLPRLELVRWLSAFYFDSPFFKPWQPISYMFMHANFQHILFNMFAVFMFGPIIEQALGYKRFIEYYFITGLGALVLHMAVQAFEVYSVVGSVTLHDGMIPANISADGMGKLADIYQSPILGASGAVFGILLAFAYLFPNVELMLIFLPVPIKAKYFVAIYVVIELFSGIARFSGDSVAHFAHIGGALFGFILLRIWGYRSSKHFY